jgi:hypothetical protein
MHDCVYYSQQDRAEKIFLEPILAIFAIGELLMELHVHGA